SQLYLANFANIKIADELRRVDGVSDVNIFGAQDYSMRIWVDPERLAALNLTAGDVANAIREQNQPVAAGHIGQTSAAGSVRAGSVSDGSSLPSLTLPARSALAPAFEFPITT